MSKSVLIVTPDTVGPVTNGGMGTACFHYARTLADAGIPTDLFFSGILTEAEHAGLQDWYTRFSIGFHSLRDAPAPHHATIGMKWYNEHSLRIMQFLRDRAYRYVIFQDWKANGFWSARSKRMGLGFQTVRLGLMTHAPNQWQREEMQFDGIAPIEAADMEWMESEAIASADTLISPSQHMLSWLREKGYVIPKDVVILPYTFADPAVGQTPMTTDTDHLIFFGRLESRNGLQIFCQALTLLRERGHDPVRKISFLGKTAEVLRQSSEEYLRALREEFPTTHIVVHNVDHARAITYIRDQNGFVVLSSLLDDFRFTVIESIANGFSFIASTAGGITEMVDPVVTFEPTADALARKLASRADVASRTARHPYSPEISRSAWVSHVREVLCEPTPAEPIKVPCDRPEISFCIPFYRHGDFLQRLVLAILGQRNIVAQIVMINDGTPADECGEFDRFAEELRPLGHIFVTQENRGAGAARNRAASLATNDLLLFFDADNVPFPDLAFTLFTALDTAGADTVSSHFAIVPPLRRTPVSSDTLAEYRAPGGSLVRALFKNTLGDTLSIMRKHTFEALGGFTERRDAWEDHEFYLRALLNGYKHLMCPEILMYYTRRPGSRNRTVDPYGNRASLLATVMDAPGPASAALVEVLVRQVLVAPGAADL